MTNKITVQVCIRSGKRTPLDVEAYFFGKDDNIYFGNELFLKSHITECIRKVIFKWLKEQKRKILNQGGKIMELCEKCGSKLALVSVHCTPEWDDEPYENGITENVTNKAGVKLEKPNLYMNIVILLCPDCNYTKWLSIEECNYEINDVKF